MQEAYRIGVTLALQGNIARIIERLIEQFGALDSAIKKTQGSLNTLVGGMRALRNEADGAALAMGKAAIAMERSARAGATRAATAARDAGMTGGFMSGASPYKPPSENRALVPYRSDSTGFTLEGTAYTPYGGYGPGRPPRSPTPGALVPLGLAAGGAGAGGFGEGPGGPGGGFTMNGGPYDPIGENALAKRPYQPGPGGPIPLVNPYGGGLGDKVTTERKMRFNELGGGLTALGGAELLKSTAKAGAEVQNVQAGLRAQLFTDDQVKRAYDEAFDVQRSVRGTDVLGNLKLLSKLQATFQNADEALELLPKIAAYQVQLSRFDKGGDSEMMALIKGLEEKGALGQIDPKTGKFALNKTSIDEYLNTVLAATAITRGNVDPQQILQFQRSMNWTAQSLSPDQLIARQLAMIQAVGATKAGHGIFSIEQQWAAGQMSQAAVDLAIQFGIIKGGGTAKTNPNIKTKAFGTYIVLPQGWAPGVSEELRNEPQGFLLNHILPKLDDYLKKQIPNWDKMTPQERSFQEIGLGSAITSRDPGRAYLGMLIQLHGLIDRDERSMQEALKQNSIEKLTQNNAQVNFTAFTASMKAFQIAMASPAMQAAVRGIDTLSGGINSMSKIANAHPEASGDALKMLAAGIGTLAVGTVAYLALTALGGTAGLLAAVGIGAEAAFLGLQKIDQLLKATWPGFFNDKGLEDIKKNGIMRPDPTRFITQFDDAHQWAHNLDHWTKNFILHPLGGDSPTAPSAAAQSGGSSAPLMVHVTNTTDLMHGISSGQARSAHLPPTGMSGSDLRIDPSGAYSGFIPLP